MTLTDISDAYEKGLDRAFDTMDYIDAMRSDMARFVNKAARRQLLAEISEQQTKLDAIQSENRALEYMMLNKRIIQLIHIKNSLGEE